MTPARIDRIVARLRADPAAAFAVAARLQRVAGPWVADRPGWTRHNAHGGICVSSYGVSSPRALMHHDDGLRAQGFVLVGGLPAGLPDGCVKLAEMRQGRPRLARPNDPIRTLGCWLHEGHDGHCRALAPMERGYMDDDHTPGRLVWWSEVAT